MATMTRVLFWRHFRSDPNFHVLHYRGGKQVSGGRGLSFWFLPLSASIAEIPRNDQDQPFLFHGKSSDFQDVTAQGTITYRIVDADKMAPRIDFTIDLASGIYLKTPLEQLSELLTQLAQQLAWDYMTRTPLRDILVNGVDEIRTRIREGLINDSGLQAMGLEIVSIRVSDIAPTPDLEKALQAPTREAIQQESDEATFQRRAMAVEKERAIAENELQNQIELARREEELISQQGQNSQREAHEDAESQKIQSEAEAERKRLSASARADGIRVVQQARVESEGQRMDIYRNLPTQVMVGLAAQKLAGNLTRIDHLNLAGDSLGPLLTNLVQAGTRHLEDNGQNQQFVAEPDAAELPETDFVMGRGDDQPDVGELDVDDVDDELPSND